MIFELIPEIPLNRKSVHSPDNLTTFRNLLHCIECTQWIGAANPPAFSSSYFPLYAEWIADSGDKTFFHAIVVHGVAVSLHPVNSVIAGYPFVIVRNGQVVHIPLVDAAALFTEKERFEFHQPAFQFPFSPVSFPYAGGIIWPRHDYHEIIAVLPKIQSASFIGAAIPTSGAIYRKRR